MKRVIAILLCAGIGIALSSCVVYEPRGYYDYDVPHYAEGGHHGGGWSHGWR